MNRYNPKSACIKCGECNASDKYFNGYRSAYIGLLAMDSGGRNQIYRTQAELDATQHERECIIRTCRNCGWQWREAPLTPMEPIPLVYPEEPEVELPPETLSLYKKAMAEMKRIMER